MKSKKNKILIGIDPDLEKSGFAIKQESKIELLNLTFLQLTNKLNELVNVHNKENIEVYLEKGELNKSNFHVKTIPKSVRDIKVYCAKIGANTGKNFAVASLIEEFLIDLQITYFIVKPTSKKRTHLEINNLIKLPSKTNQEQRDALMLIIGR